MSRINIQVIEPVDLFGEQEWRTFLRENTHRGFNINNIAKRFKKAQSCTYDKDLQLITLISKSGRMIEADIGAIQLADRPWTFSHWIHSWRMSDPESDYAVKFNARIDDLAKCLTQGSFPIIEEVELEPLPFLRDIPIHATKDVFKDSFMEFTRDIPEGSDLRRLLSLSVCRWIREDIYNSEREELEKFPSVLPLIEAKIKALNETMQLQERLDRLSYRVDFTVLDILSPFEISTLQYVLMMDAELKLLKTSEISESIGKRLSPFFFFRIEPLAQAKNEPLDQSSLTEDAFSELLLIDIPRLEAEALNRLIKKLPAWLVPLIPSIEVDKLEISNWPDEHLNMLFKSREHVRQLRAHQLDLCLNRVDPNSLNKLSKKQIWELDYMNMDKSTFDAIFPRERSRTSALVEGLEIEKIEQLREYFDADRWSYVPEATMWGLDYTSMDKVTFDAIFPRGSSRTRDLMEGLEIEKIEQLRAHFDEDRWIYVPEEKRRVLAI